MIKQKSTLLRFTATLLVITFQFQLSAQYSLSGIVRSNPDSTLGFVVVSLKGTAVNAVTLQADSTGRFLFKAQKPDHYSLSIEHIGFTTQQVFFDLYRDTSISIMMERSANMLSEVVVQGNKNMLEKTSEKFTLNIENSIASTGTDALQSLSRIPGIRIINEEISIAGKGGLKAMINNRLIQLTGQDLLRFLKSIPANEIEKIELVTLPAAKYEADGNAGLINIVMKKARMKGFSGNALLAIKRYSPGQSTVYDIHNFGELNAGLNLTYVSGKWSTFLSANYNRDRHLEGFETDIFYPSKTWKQSDTGLYRYKNYNITTGADYQISSKATIGFTYLFDWNNYNGSDHVNNPVFGKDDKLDSSLLSYATYYPVAKTNSINLHLDLKLDTSGKMLFLNADYFNYYRTDISDFESNRFYSDGSYIDGSNTRYFDTNKQDIDVYTLKADLDLPTAFARFSLGGKLSFISTYSNAFYYNKTGTDNLEYNTDLSNEFQYMENIQSLYASMDKKIGKLNIRAGLRGEQTQTKGYSYTLDETTTKNYLKLFPSVSLSFAHDKDNTFDLSMNRRIHRPSFWNLNPFKSLYTPDSYGEGNPFLQPEYTVNVELSHKYKSILTSALFFNNTENGFRSLTFAFPDTSLVYTKPVNFLRTRRIGISEGVSFRAGNFWESYETVSFYYTNSQSHIPNADNVDGLGLYFSSSNNFFLNSSKTIAATLNFWHQFHEIDQIGRSGNYYKLDMGMRATFRKKIEFTLTVNDLFRSSASTFSSVINGMQQRFTNFQFNRYVQLSFNYRFGSSKNGADKERSGNAEERGRIH